MNRRDGGISEDGRGSRENRYDGGSGYRRNDRYGVLELFQPL